MQIRKHYLATSLVAAFLLLVGGCSQEPEAETAEPTEATEQATEQATEPTESTEATETEPTESTEATEAEPTESTEPATASADSVKIPTHNWSSQLVGAEIVGKLFEMAGETVEYVSLDSQTVYQSMCEGDIDIVHEVWEGAFGEAFEKVVGEGCVIDLVTHDAKTREEWWYPAHVKELCPGLPDWEALNACADQFARADSDGKGVFIGGPVDWLKHDAEKVEALGMNFVVKNAGSAATIWAELKAGIDQNQAVVVFNWTPNFIEALYEGEFVEFPEHDPACVDDPSWGINPDKAYDCGNPKGGYLKIGVSNGFEEKHPKAFAVAKKINFTNLDVAQQSNYVDTDGMEVSAAADRWLAENEDRWKAWIN